MINDIYLLLDSYNSNTLWEMARAAHLNGTSGLKLKKESLALLLQQEYFKPERIKAAYQKLSETEKTIINHLLWQKGELPCRVFKRELLRAGLVTEAPPAPPPKKVSFYVESDGPTIYGRSVAYLASLHSPNSTIFEDTIARLTLAGLVFSQLTHVSNYGQAPKMQFHPGDVLYIPPFVSQHLPPPKPPAIRHTHWQPTQIRQMDPQLFLRNLYLYWETVRRTPMAMIQTGFVNKRGLKALNESLLVPDPALEKAKQEHHAPHLYFLRQVLEGLQLVRVEKGFLQAETGNGRSLPPFWQRPTVEQVATCLDIWRNLPQPVTLTHPRASFFTLQYRYACQQLLTYLTQSTPSVWIEANDLWLSLQDQDAQFLFPDRLFYENKRSQGWYSGVHYYRNSADLLTQIDELEKAFINEVVAGSLYQLGLIELGFKQGPTADGSLLPDNQWAACRLSPLGLAVFQNHPLPHQTMNGQIILQPNFQILAIGPVPLPVLAQLDLFCSRQKVDKGVFEYQLTRESVYAAQKAGLTVEEIRRFLAEQTAQDLPQNIRRSLDEWASHQERIVFRQGVTLLQAASETLLAQLMADAQTGPFLAKPVATAVALVQTGQQAPLIHALQSQGLFPVLADANPQSANNTILVDKNGQIRPLFAVPSLHLRQRLAPFSEETANGWQLTEKSVARAGGNKQKVQTILAELAQLNRGPLALPLIQQIKTWGGYYGSVQIGTHILIEFQDATVLAELLQHPDLQPLLRPFPAGERALATVKPENLTAVQTILTQLGIPINKS